MATNTSLTIDQLERAIAIQEQIEKLQAELAAVLGQQAGTGRKRGRPAKNGGTSVGGGSSIGKKRAKRVMSPEAKEKIAAAQRKRWAKTKKTSKKAAAPTE